MSEAMQPDPRYFVDMRKHHNGYSAEMREQFSDLKEPESAGDAFRELLREAEQFGSPWVEIGALPERGRIVLAFYLNELPMPRIVRAQYVRKHELTER